MTSEFETHPELVQKRARSILAQRLLIAVGVVVLLLILSLLSFNAVASIASRRALLDCTTPTGECYKESQKRTSALITNLITTLVGAGQDRAEITREVTRAAAVCNNKFPTPVDENAFRDCIDKEMAK